MEVFTKKELLFLYKNYIWIKRISSNVLYKKEM